MTRFGQNVREPLTGGIALLVLAVGVFPFCSSETPASEGGSAGAAGSGAGAGGTGGGADVDASRTDARADVGAADSGMADGRSFTDGSADVDARSCEILVGPTPSPASNELDLIEGQAPLSRWWIVTSTRQADANGPTFTPPASPPAPTPTTADGRTFVRLMGVGLGPIDYGLLAYSPLPTLSGGGPTDLGDGLGLTFDAKGTNLWIDVHTIDTEPRFCLCDGADCYSGYRYKVPVTNSWASYAVTWDQFELPSFVVNRRKLSPLAITTIAFGGLGEDFDMSLDNLRLADRPGLDGGAD